MASFYANVPQTITKTADGTQYLCDVYGVRRRIGPPKLSKREARARKRLVVKARGDLRRLKAEGVVPFVPEAP